MRSQAAIVERFKVAQNDFMPFGVEALCEFLDEEHLQAFLKPEERGKRMPPRDHELTDAGVIDQMREYAAFGWTKVRDHRGISATRTMLKMREWLWLLGDNEMQALCDSHNAYAPYGAPVLRAICQKYGFPIPEAEDIQRMALGEACEPDCCQGCLS